MGILQVNNLRKSYGPRTVLAGIDFMVRRGDKVGLIGGNGAGKTTLVRCLLGLEPPDGGTVKFSAGETVGYVQQEVAFTCSTLVDELSLAFREVIASQQRIRQLEEAVAGEPDGEKQAALLKEYAIVRENFERGGGYEYENIIRRVAFGLGFSEEDLRRDPDHFSGGQKTRICLARALVRQPDYLLLDEPTNHLDIAMTEWLEDYLTGYAGGVLIVSHDRYFLDRVATRILELENGELTVYNGNYTAYLAQKAERLASLRSAYDKQQALVVKTEAFIRRYQAGVKAKQARGRSKQLARLERIVLPPASGGFDYFVFNPPGECGQRVAELEDITVTYGTRRVLDRLSLLVRRGDGVALVGPNGAGKTTLLRVITGELEPAAGRVKLGSRVKIGYFSQEHADLNSAWRVVDELMAGFGLSEERARHYLGPFMFSGDDVYKLIGRLSGGEKARLALLKLMLTGANFLILDEPTNHLDIPAREAVEEAINGFPGTFLVVSHDRYFLDKVANCVLELSAGRLREYPGNYSYYREHRPAGGEVRNPGGSKEPAGTAPAAGKTGGRKTAGRPARPRDQERELKKLEEEITAREAEIAALENRLNDPANQTDPVKSAELAAEYEAAQAVLAARYDKWLRAQS